MATQIYPVKKLIIARRAPHTQQQCFAYTAAVSGGADGLNERDILRSSIHSGDYRDDNLIFKNNE
jgi:hypothetical protein